MNSQCCYCITTKRFILRCNHLSWLKFTQDLYNEVILFYYNLLLDLNDQGEVLAIDNSRQVLRRLETLTIQGREKQPVKYPIPWTRLPLYFRRAAINMAVSEAKRCFESENRSGRTKCFHCSVIFYKGSYKKLTEKEICLKVWNGEVWAWMHCRLSGNQFPSECNILSPSLVLKDKSQYLNVPVREAVQDGRKVFERIRQETKICSIQFTNEDTVAVSTILNSKGVQTGVHFFRGGKEYSHMCRKVLEKIAYSKPCLRISNEDFKQKYLQSGMLENGPLFNQKHWRKLKHLSEYYSHCISRQIVEYCVEQQVGILVLPAYSKDYSRYVRNSAGNWSPIHLGSCVRAQLSYKAWKAGIVILETSALGCGKVCSICGAPIHRKKSVFMCENGHRGNRHLNTARNLGKKCLESLLRNQRCIQ